ncbi:MAG: DUF72 domain-containing protein [Planctomycetes bacterium]|nr:DUF72 domain-containing protein [Planctomycetota bacterium]
MADAQGKRVAANVHVGTMGWSYDFWKSNFYPEKLASKDFLSYFATQFRSVEVDSTFYRPRKNRYRLGKPDAQRLCVCSH